MLDEIQSRDNELRENRSQLEERVMHRTRELEIANSELATSKKQAESVARRMKYHAHHDALTGLPNRILLNDRITTELAHARRKQGLVAVLFLDLDRFKIMSTGKKVPLLHMTVLAGLTTAVGHIAITVTAGECITLDGLAVGGHIDTMTLHAEARSGYIDGR